MPSAKRFAANRRQAAARRVLGVLSLILWALMIIVTFKYVMILLRADNQGEGGTLSLLALAQRAHGRRPAVLLLGMSARRCLWRRAHHSGHFGAVGGRRHEARHQQLRALYFADHFGIIIVPVSGAKPWNSRGGALFGPVTLIWFAAWRGGIANIVADPGVLAALSPLHAISFLATTV